MKEIILYGAGKRGKKTADLLITNNYQIAGFCDTNICGQKIEGGGNNTNIFIGMDCSK